MKAIGLQISLLRINSMRTTLILALFSLMVVVQLPLIACNHPHKRYYSIPQNPVELPISDLNNEYLVMYLDRQLIPMLANERNAKGTENRIYLNFVDKAENGAETVVVTCIVGDLYPNLCQDYGDSMNGFSVLKDKPVEVFVSDTIHSKWVKYTGKKTTPMQWKVTVTDLLTINDAQIDITLIVSDDEITIKDIEKWELFQDKQPWTLIPLKPIKASVPYRVFMGNNPESQKCPDIVAPMLFP